MKNASITLLAVSTVLLLAGTALAQEDDLGMDFTTTTTTTTTPTTTSTSGFDYPVNFSERPLTLAKHAVRGNFMVTIGGCGIVTVLGAVSDTCGALDFGGSFGVLEDLEVGINHQRFGAAPIFRGSTPAFGVGLIPIIVAPSGDFGDIPMYARYSFLRESDWELAVDAVLLLPSNTDFAFTAGMPVRYTGIDNVAIDLGANFTIVANGGSWIDLTFPVRFTFNFTDEAFLTGATGLGFTRLNGPNDIELPIAIGGGYTLLIKDKVMMDFLGEFGFRPIVEMTNSVDVIDASTTWFITFGTTIWTDSLF